LRGVGDVVGGCASLAALLEVSAYPKPGNVHRLRDFQGTSYEHFLAGGVSLAPWMASLAERGAKAMAQDGGWEEVRLGEHVRGAVEDMMRWQRGGNVHLGIILLFAPLAAAAGASLRVGAVEPGELRDALVKAVAAATPGDAADIYRAIGAAMSVENLGSVERLDVSDPSSIDLILRRGVTPLKIFEDCSARDMICGEWATGFRVTFEEGHPYLAERLTHGSINDAVVDTFLRILSRHPDSLIRRKSGDEAAEAVSGKALTVLEAGGASSEAGKRLVAEMDDALQAENGGMNPGTSADLTAASLFVHLLGGWRP
jgi:triphosphoribosyl-dephospho-CoA synthase